mgnify:CR=1 FL=1
MKQIVVKSFLCVLGLLFATATASAQTADLQQEIKETSYAIGLAQTQGLEEYLTNRLNVDLTYKDAFVKGVVEGAERANNPESAAYFAGIQIGTQIAIEMVKGINKELFGENTEYSISLEEFMKGFVYGIKGASEGEINKASENAADKIQKVKAIMLEKEFGK